MSGITRKLFEVLLLAEAPMTHAELKAQLGEFPRARIGALLTNQCWFGRITREPKGDGYAYSLSEETRFQLQHEGVDTVIREKTTRAAQPKRDEVVDREACTSLHAAQAAAILMHAPGNAHFDLDPVEAERLRSLAPSVGSVLPWLEEEEAPPVIGERWRDALRPRPLDD